MQIEFDKEYLRELYQTGKTSDKKHRFQPQVIKGYKKAIDVLKVNPIRYLFVPRVLSGFIMMPPVVLLASTVGVITGAITAYLTAKLGFRAYFDSAWLGIYMKDLGVCLLKAFCFGGVIALISSSCGYYATGGAKGVGEATTKAVVWSFVAIVILDMIFAMAFFF